ncbi:hypothetical protein SAMN05920897_10368 [Alkalispirochaeta americana]|uniref:Uncharacterized protein n=1 Tax=Alkalispirochaeta americana TaxID=159291 RepID=A0A1N6PNW0_9SPIO|nr:hypothetical protein [Alkalispirochaeta americana]SIQ06050.1 hypothetical protein SAMN05920897_10368 [Alkalispirochaeta americana]
MKEDDPPLSPAPWRNAGSEELHFHSRRTEMEACRSRRWQPPQGSFFRRNRGLAIALIDVVVVMILFFIYLFFLRPLAGQVRLGEYRLSGETYLLAEEILVVVTIRNSSGSRSGSDDPEPRARELEAGGFQEPQPVVTVSSSGQRISDLAPRAGQERSIPLRLAREDLEDEESLEVLVVIGRDQTVLSMKISGD